MAKKTKIQETSVAGNGGMVVTREVRSYHTQSEDAYVKLYLRHLCFINGLHKSEHSVLNEMLKLMDFTNEAVLTPRRRQNLIENTGFSAVTVARSLRALVDKTLLKRIERGTYLVNPYFFGKGSWSDICSLRLTIDYNPHNYEVRTEVGKNEISQDQQ